MQNEIHQVLLQNLGNRLTPELVNGLAAKLHIIAQQGVARALQEREDEQREADNHG